MKKLTLTLALVLTALFSQPALPAQPTAASATPPSLGGLDALREVAAVAILRSVDRLGAPGGFYLTPKFHIPLPNSLDRAVQALDRNYAPTVYLAVERSMNRAAESTVSKAGDFMLKSLANVRFANPRDTLQGPAIAVTAELKSQLETALRNAMLPVIESNLVESGTQAALERMQARFEDISNGPYRNFDVRQHTLDRFIAAFFASVGEEERNIRLRPSSRSTETLRRLFSKES